MRRFLFLASLLLAVVVACGSEPTPVQPPAIPDFSPSQVPTSTAVPAITSALAHTETPAGAVASAAIPTPTPVATRRPLAAAASRLEYLEDATLIRLGTDPTTLDPHLTGDVPSAVFIVEVFGGLVTIDQNLEIVPDLARDWEISSDGKTYTFHLREDAKFHDGRPVTAQDFKWSFERIADPATEAPLVDAFLGDIVGFLEKLGGEATSVDGVQAVDDLTLTITIDAPKAYFLAKLTHPSSFVLDRNNVEGNPAWFNQPNGTGPFRLSEYEPGVILRLTRNEFYHLGPAKLQEVEFILSGGDSLLMYENDEIHVTGIALLNLEGILSPSNPLSEEVIQAPPTFDVA